MQTVPNSLQSVGFLTPRKMAPHSQPWWSGDRRVRHAETPLGVEGRVPVADPQRAVGHVAQAAPFEAGAQLEDLVDERLGLEVALAGHGAGVLVLDLGAALVDLADQHQDGLHQVQRLEAGDHHRLLVLLREGLVGRGADHGADVRRADEAVERYAPGLASGLSRMASMAAGVSTWLQNTRNWSGPPPRACGSPPRWAAWWSRSRWRRTPLRGPDSAARDLQRVGARIHHAHVGALGLGLEQAAAVRPGTRIMSP